MSALTPYRDKVRRNRTVDGQPIDRVSMVRTIPATRSMVLPADSLPSIRAAYHRDKTITGRQLAVSRPQCLLCRSIKTWPGTKLTKKESGMIPSSPAAKWPLFERRWLTWQQRQTRIALSCKELYQYRTVNQTKPDTSPESRNRWNGVGVKKTKERKKKTRHQPSGTPLRSEVISTRKLRQKVSRRQELRSDTLVVGSWCGRRRGKFPGRQATQKGGKGQGSEETKEDLGSSLAKSFALRGQSDCWNCLVAGGWGCAGGVGNVRSAAIDNVLLSLAWMADYVSRFGGVVPYSLCKPVAILV